MNENWVLIPREDSSELSESFLLTLSPILRWIEQDIAALGSRIHFVFLVGSRAHGSFDALSDFDIQVAHDQLWWQRRSLKFEGNLFDVVYSSETLYLEQVNRGTPMAIAGISTGRFISGDQRRFIALRNLADERKRKVVPVAMSEGVKRLVRGRAFTLAADIEDLLLAKEDALAEMAIHSLIDFAVKSRAARDGQKLDTKRCYRYILDAYPMLRVLVERFYMENCVRKKQSIATFLVEELYNDLSITEAETSIIRLNSAEARRWLV